MTAIKVPSVSMVFMPPSLKEGGGHIDLPLSARPSVRPIVPLSVCPSRNCVAHNSKSICTADLKLHGHIIQGVNLRTWVFSSNGNEYLRSMPQSLKEGEGYPFLSFDNSIASQKNPNFQRAKQRPPVMKSRDINVLHNYPFQCV